MEFTERLQKALNYIEEHLTERLEYSDIAKQAACSNYHFQRVFGILCGITLGEYIRNRRLTLAGAELTTGNNKVIDIALKYGYDNPDSFSKAFVKFHGITPTEAKKPGAVLNSFARLSVKISLEGANMMNYRMEEMPEMILTGYKTHFTGVPYGKERYEQEEKLFISTRAKQWLLRGAAANNDAYCVITNVNDEGYDFWYTHILDQYFRDNLYNSEVTGVTFMKEMNFETITVPKQMYAVFETSNRKEVIDNYFDILGLRTKLITEWLPEKGMQFAEAPEIVVYHWLPRDERKIQIWMPVEVTEK